MQSVLNLLNVIFSALTASVNKAFRKSQRATIIFYPKINNDYAGLFATKLDNWVSVTNKTIPQQIAALNMGNGRYTVQISNPLDLYSKTADNVGHGSTIIVEKFGDVYAVVSQTESLRGILTAANEYTADAERNAKEAAQGYADTAKEEAQTYTNDAIKALDLEEQLSLLEHAAGVTAENYAQQKANQAQQAAIYEATNTARLEANNARQAAIDSAALTAQEKANQARLAAEAAAKAYTDVETSKLKLAAKKGWGFSRWVGLVSGFNPDTEQTTVQGMPVVGDVNGELGMNYLVRVELRDMSGNLIQDTESVLQVEKGLDGDGKMITEEIVVSTEDELLYTVTAGLNGEKHLSFVEKQDVTVLELYKKLSSKIETHVSESELEAALEAQRLSILATLDADLV